MMYDGILLKPQLDDLYLKHFNPNHDPKSGQFTSGNNSFSGHKKSISDSEVIKKREKIDKDFPELKKMKIKSKEDGLMYWLNQVEAQTDLSPEQFRKQYPKDEATLSNEILKKSGDWYNSTGKSEGFKKVLKKYDKLKEKYENDPNKWSIDSNFRKERQKIYDEICGVVLNDLGYENTKRNRIWIQPIIIWD